MKPERLTEKVNNNYFIEDPDVDERKAINKLGELEDIEQKLGIDLVRYLRVRIDGAYFKVPKEICDEFPTSYFEGGIVHLMVKDITALGVSVWFWDHWDATTESKEWFYPSEDLGKTWALTKEELE